MIFQFYRFGPITTSLDTRTWTYKLVSLCFIFFLYFLLILLKLNPIYLPKMKKTPHISHPTISLILAAFNVIILLFGIKWRMIWLK